MSTDIPANLVIRNLTKTFPGQVALKDFSIDVRAGEIHALVGENGSGKSTFIKCLSGYHTPDPGATIKVNGEELATPFSPTAARARGLVFIHQDLGMIPTLTVMENIALSRGFPTGWGYRIRWGKELDEARAMLAAFGHPEIDPEELVGRLPLAAQTVVAIARGLYKSDRASVIVLDEPTASMPHNEVRRLFTSIRAIAASGVGVIYVSHRLDEIFELTDRVTAIRDGSNVGTHATAELDYDSLVTLIVGRSVESIAPPSVELTSTDVALSFTDIRGPNVDGVTASVRKGEIVGITGVLGSGCSELGQILFGAVPAESGDVFRAGRKVSWTKPLDAIRAGVAYIPANRAKEGIHPRLTLRENAMLTSPAMFFKGGRYDSGAEQEYVAELLDHFAVRPADSSREAYTLSGGNQQKVVLAKWMHLHPEVIVLDEPVQGIDIGAKAEVYARIHQAAVEGAAIVMIGSEIEDMSKMCNRVLVMRQGRVVADLAGADLTRETIAHASFSSEEAA